MTTTLAKFSFLERKNLKMTFVNDQDIRDVSNSVPHENSPLKDGF